MLIVDAAMLPLLGSTSLFCPCVIVVGCVLIMIVAVACILNHNHPKVLGPRFEEAMRTISARHLQDTGEAP